MTYIAGLFVIALSVAVPAAATTWAPKDIEDPLQPGEKCRVQEPMSYGSYIYHWPSKYDQVFWPMTDPNGIWFCPASGFTAFLGDIDDLTDAQREAIRQRLSTIERPAGDDVPLAIRLKLLEASYAARQRDAGFDNRLQRTLGYLYEELGDQAQATAYRQQALQGIERALDSTTLTPQSRMEYLFVCASYQAEFAHPQEAARCMRGLDLVLAGDLPPELHDYAEYLKALKSDVAYITPGGALAPEQKPERQQIGDANPKNTPESRQAACEAMEAAAAAAEAAAAEGAAAEGAAANQACGDQ